MSKESKKPTSKRRLTFDSPKSIDSVSSTRDVTKEPNEKISAANPFVEDFLKELDDLFAQDSSSFWPDKTAGGKYVRT